ncbi:unnamed protein product [Sphagnum jensenii]|uniref:Uncharacterized protein n=1 Tax=Sphagnum jensenii TaxID=128206 RepID=A0ABP0VHX5_9BRYO
MHGARRGFGTTNDRMVVIENCAHHYQRSGANSGGDHHQAAGGGYSLHWYCTFSRLMTSLCMEDTTENRD